MGDFIQPRPSSIQMIVEERKVTYLHFLFFTFMAAQVNESRIETFIIL